MFQRARLIRRRLTTALLVAVVIAFCLLVDSLQASVPTAPVSDGPAFIYSLVGPPPSVQVGESFALGFGIHHPSHEGDHGGISVSFPDLTSSGGNSSGRCGSSSYSSSQGSITTVDYTTGASNVYYCDRGDSVYTSTGDQTAVRYLLVESDNPSWPTSASRTLWLRVTANEPGEFRINYRYWVCGNGYEDCRREPTGSERRGNDQQGWGVGIITVNVEAATLPPRIDRLGCSPSTVEVGESVSCSPRLHGGDPDEYLWGSIGGSPWFGKSRNFSTQWDSPGRKMVVFEVCNDGGCDSGEQYIIVDEPATPPPRIDSLGCFPDRVEVAESVSCRPDLSGGSPEEYLWGSLDGTPWFGESRNFSTQWDSPGRKMVVFEVCNDGGCDSGEQYITVDEQATSTPRIDSLDCFPDRVEVGEYVSCNAALSGNVSAGYIWGAVGASILSGYNPSFSTSWDLPGAKRVVLEVCNDGGCDRREQEIIVDEQATSTPRIDSLDCFPDRVEVREYVSCNAALSGNVSAGYIWGAVGASILSGYNPSFSTSWDLPGAKRVVLEVCNDGGCDRREQEIIVEERAGTGSLQIYTDGPVVPGSTIDITGADFPAYTDLGRLEIGGVSVLLPYTPVTDSYGTFWTQVGVPWLSPGSYELVASAGSVEASSYIQIEEPSASSPPQINSLGCSPGTVAVGEHVSCQPEFTTGSATEYTWRAPGGSPASGNKRAFRTRWASPGLEIIVLTVCNKGGCDSADQSITVGDAAGQPITVGDAAGPDAYGDSPLSPYISIDTDSGVMPGWVIEITGSNFAPNTAIERLEIGAAALPIENHFVNSNGAFAVSAVIPALDRGTYAVVVAAGGTEAITAVEIDSPVLEIGPQSIYPGEISEREPEKLFQVYVSEGRRLRVAVDGPDDADFDLHMRRIGENPTTSLWTWQSTGPDSSESISIAGTEAGWYEMRVSSHSGKGRFMLRTRTDEARLEIVFADPIVLMEPPHVESWGGMHFQWKRGDLALLVYKRCSFFSRIWPGPHYRPATLNRQVTLDLTNYAMSDPACRLDPGSNEPWGILITGAHGNSLLDVRLHLAYDNVVWELSAIDLSSEPVPFGKITTAHPVGTLPFSAQVCLPSCEGLGEATLVGWVYNFLIGDDLDTLTSAEAPILERILATELILLNFIPGPGKAVGAAAKTGAYKVVAKSGKHSSGLIDPSNVKAAIGRAQRESDTLARVLARSQLKAIVRSIGTRVKDIAPERVDDLISGELAPSVVGNVRVNEAHVSELWPRMLERLKKGIPLEEQEPGLYHELKVAAAAKELGLTLPDKWLRRKVVFPDKTISELDVVAEDWAGDLVALESKQNWFSYDSDNSWGTIQYRLERGIAALEQLAADKGVKSKGLFIVAKNPPPGGDLAWIGGQGIGFIEVPN